MKSTRKGAWAAGSVVMCAVAALIGGVAIFVLDPATCRWLPPCPFHAVTGLFCPGCGTLRALHHLMHADLLGAMRLNPAAVLMSPFVLYGLASEASKHIRGRRLPSPRLSHHWGWVLLGGILLYGILRNIPAYPFRLLAPH